MSHFFSTLENTYRKNAQYRRTLAELNAMSDAEANDLGLNRVDFARIAAEAVYGR